MWVGCRGRISQRGGSDLLPPSEEGPSSIASGEIRSFRPDPRLSTLSLLNLDRSKSARRTSCLGLQGVLEGCEAASTLLEMWFAFVRATSLRMVSPTTIPLTPPSGFWSAEPDGLQNDLVPVPLRADWPPVRGVRTPLHSPELERDNPMSCLTGLQPLPDWLLEQIKSSSNCSAGWASATALLISSQCR